MALLANPFYKNDLLRKYVAVFGKLFDGLTIERFDDSGSRVQTIPVPIHYAPKERYLVRLNTDPDLDREVAIQLPVMSYEMVSLTYNSQRKLQSTLKFRRQSSSDADRMKTTFMPVPYDIIFSMSILCKYFDDSLTLVEQIVPFFRPDLTIAMNTMPEVGLVQDIPIVLQDVTLEDSYEGDFEQRRVIIWTLTFLMKGYLFGPVGTQGVIKRAIVDHNIYGFGNTELDDFVSRITVQPGLKSDGTPTSNAELSIPYTEIEANDNYGIVETKTDG